MLSRFPASLWNSSRAPHRSRRRLMRQRQHARRRAGGVAGRRSPAPATSQARPQHRELLHTRQLRQHLIPEVCVKAVPSVGCVASARPAAPVRYGARGALHAAVVREARVGIGTAGCRGVTGKGQRDRIRGSSISAHAFQC